MKTSTMVNRVSRLSVCAALFLSVAGCKSQQPATAPPVVQQPETKTAPPTPLAEKKEELGKQTWDPEWDRIVEESLPPDMLSARAARDVRGFCPRFGAMSDLDKKAFWAYFFQALAGAEAGLKPTTDVRHTEPEIAKKDGVTGRMIRSEGLLQLTYMDSDRYGCDFDWERDKHLPEKDPAKTILQPKNNLMCGIRILDNQLMVLKKPLLSRTSYWATLQPQRPSYKVFAKQMTNVPAACRKASGSGRVGNGKTVSSASLRSEK